MTYDLSLVSLLWIFGWVKRIPFLQNQRSRTMSKIRRGESTKAHKMSQEKAGRSAYYSQILFALEQFARKATISLRWRNQKLENFVAPNAARPCSTKLRILFHAPPRYFFKFFFWGGFKTRAFYLNSFKFINT